MMKIRMNSPENLISTLLVLTVIINILNDQKGIQDAESVLFVLSENESL